MNVPEIPANAWFNRSTVQTFKVLQEKRSVHFQRESASGLLRSTVMTVESEGPSIEVEQVEQSRSLSPGRWLFRWRIENKSETAMHLLSVRVPHGRFKGEEREFEPAVKIATQEHFILELVVACREPPNTKIENAFLILLFNWQENQWRVFVRLQITIDHQGRPATTTESITVQQVGFSGISS